MIFFVDGKTTASYFLTESRCVDTDKKSEVDSKLINGCT